jgi:signal peptidase I
MNWIRRHKLNKAAKALIKDARHVQYMREDIAPAEEIRELQTCREAVREARQSRAGETRLLAAMDQLGQAMEKVNPPRSRPKLRENLDVLVVAIAAAMAIRAYFIQPFKIPTGSMQPTLNGILEEPAEGRATLLDRHPLRAVKWLLTGKTRQPNGKYKIAGDHILVNRVKYNFVPPKRSEVVVFDTRGISPKERQMVLMTVYTERGGEPRLQIPFIRGRNGKLLDAATARPLEDIQQELNARAGMPLIYTMESEERIHLTYYIKRLVGLPGEKISIQNNRLVADGKLIDRPECFVRQYTHPAYPGYLHAGKLASGEDVMELKPDEFLPFGDNARNSQDGRYFGPVKTDAILGPAFFVYWPFGGHWGPIH